MRSRGATRASGVSEHVPGLRTTIILAGSGDLGSLSPGNPASTRLKVFCRLPANHSALLWLALLRPHAGPGLLPLSGLRLAGAPGRFHHLDDRVQVLHHLRLQLLQVGGVGLLHRHHRLFQASDAGRQRIDLLKAGESALKGRHLRRKGVQLF